MMRAEGEIVYLFHQDLNDSREIELFPARILAIHRGAG